MSDRNDSPTRIIATPKSNFDDRSPCGACRILAQTVSERTPSDLGSEVMMKSILDRSFRYTSSDQTDVRKTFARVRREMQMQPQRTEPETGMSIAPLRIARAAGGLPQPFAKGDEGAHCARRPSA